MTTRSAASTSNLEALAAPVRAVDALMLGHLSAQPMPVDLRGAIEYALLGGGKRLRPMMVLWSAAAVGGRVDAGEAQAAAAAVEMVHAFSLVHDDLPAMDDDDLRRGRPTLHRRSGEAMAILAGDAMMPLAIELIIQRVSPAALTVRLIDELCSATRDMISGQVYDMTLGEGPRGPGAEGPRDKEGNDPQHSASLGPLAPWPLDPSLARLRTIHRHKTAALLRASCRMGALCAGAGEAALAAVTAYAEATGLMFQIVDDLLDVTGTTDQIGKKAGKDAAQGKLTYPGVMGVEASRAEVARLHSQALAALDPLGDAAEPLRRICDYLAVRRR